MKRGSNHCFRTISRKITNVYFCGSGHFISAFEFTKIELASDRNFVVKQISSDEIESFVDSSDILIPFMAKVRKDVVLKAKNLKLILQFGVGLEGIDHVSAKSNGIRIAKIPSNDCGNALSCAEHCIYLALSVLRRQKEMNFSLLSNKLGVPTGKTLFQSKAVIIGLGNIGQSLSTRLTAFGTEVHALVRPGSSALNFSVERQQSLGLTSITPMIESNRICWEQNPTDNTSNPNHMHWREVLGQADIIFLCCHQHAGNIGMIDDSFLSSIKPGAILINIARGGLLDYPAVHRSLLSVDSQTGQPLGLGGLGIDVFHTEPFPIPSDPLSFLIGSPSSRLNQQELSIHQKQQEEEEEEVEPLGGASLLSLQNVVVTPHVGGVTELSYRNMAKIVAANARRIHYGPKGNEQNKSSMKRWEGELEGVIEV